MLILAPGQSISMNDKCHTQEVAMLRPRRLVLPLLFATTALCLLLTLAGSLPSAAAPATSESTETPACPTPSRYAVPTPEPLWGDPVTSPTSLLTQTVSVYLGRGRQIEIASEAGRVITVGFFSAYTPARLPI